MEDVFSDMVGWRSDNNTDKKPWGIQSIQQRSSEEGSEYVSTVSLGHTVFQTVKSFVVKS